MLARYTTANSDIIRFRSDAASPLLTHFLRLTDKICSTHDANKKSVKPAGQPLDALPLLKLG